METLLRFKAYLQDEEKSALTVEKYIRDASKFLQWLEGRRITKGETLAFKAHLMECYAVASVNSMLSSLNCYLALPTFLQAEKILKKTIAMRRAMSYNDGERGLKRVNNIERSGRR